MKISRKSILILIGSFLLLVIASLVYYLNRQKVELTTPSITADNNQPVFVQEFMSVDEKKALSMPEDLRVQIINRDQDGSPMTFKIINSDADILSTNVIPSVRPDKK